MSDGLTLSAWSPAPATLTRPGAGEHAQFYAGYVAAVPEGDVRVELTRQVDELRALFGGMSEERGLHRYAPGKWSVKDVIQHVTDTERIMSYRLLRVARGDATALPGFEQDDYVVTASADRRTVAALLDELVAVRVATLALLAGLDDDAWTRRGVASGQPVSARALAYVLAGHVRHHVAILHERYLG